MKRTIFEEEHEQFRESVRRFMHNEVAPKVDRWRAEGCVGRDIWHKGGGQGLLCMWTDFRYEQIVAEENILYGDIGLDERKMK